MAETAQSGAAPALEIGQRASYSKTATDADILLFLAISGDNNPIHIDEESAKKTRFGRRILPGIWSAGLISALLASRLPGPGSIYLSQTLNFKRPVFPGDTITATAEITAIRREKGIVTLTTTCSNQAGEIVLEGEAVVMLPRN